MSRLTSEHFVDRTSELLREHGGGDVTLSMVLDACGAQKGSLYHFFPGGKDELVSAAVKKMHACAASDIRQCIEETESAAEGVKRHLLHVAKLIDRPILLCPSEVSRSTTILPTHSVIEPNFLVQKSHILSPSVTFMNLPK